MHSPGTLRASTTQTAMQNRRLRLSKFATLYSGVIFRRIVPCASPALTMITECLCPRSTSTIRMIIALKESSEGNSSAHLKSCFSASSGCAVDGVPLGAAALGAAALGATLAPPLFGAIIFHRTQSSKYSN